MARDVKKALTPAEWYSYKRDHPKKYRLLKEHIRDVTMAKPIRYKGITFVELVIPRRWFTFGHMLCFLTKYRHLADYAYIDFEERTFQGKETVLIGIDEKAVSLGNECDYFWSETKVVLEKLCYFSESKEKSTQEE
jgi:hypothetical protein